MVVERRTAYDIEFQKSELLYVFQFIRLSISLNSFVSKVFESVTVCSADAYGGIGTHTQTLVILPALSVRNIKNDKHYMIRTQPREGYFFLSFF